MFSLHDAQFPVIVYPLRTGNEPTAACGGCREASEWQRSEFEAAGSAAHKFRVPQQLCCGSIFVVPCTLKSVNMPRADNGAFHLRESDVQDRFHAEETVYPKTKLFLRRNIAYEETHP